MFLKIISCSTLRIGPYLFYIKQFITQFKTTEKNDRSPYSIEKAAIFLMHALMTCEIMRSKECCGMTLRVKQIHQSAKTCF